ncbi:MAG: hypothetical protein MHPSP_004604, partial [Paramarteilia canceri]
MSKTIKPEVFGEPSNSYLQDLNEAVASIETGPTYPVEEIFAWMDTWGINKEKPLAE